MNTCQQMEANVDAYLAGALSSEASEALEAHAAECARCGPLLETRTRLPYAFAPEIAPPGAVRARVLSGVESAEQETEGACGAGRGCGCTCIRACATTRALAAAEPGATRGGDSRAADVGRRPSSG